MPHSKLACMVAILLLLLVGQAWAFPPLLQAQSNQDLLQLNNAADVAADFIETSYLSNCNIKFIQDSQQTQIWSQALISKLNELKSTKPIGIFDVNDNQTFTDPTLDLFLTWGNKACMINVWYLEPDAIRDPALADYTMKISTRDRTSFYFVAYTGGAEQRSWIKTRLRNFFSSCALSLKDLSVECFEDEQDNVRPFQAKAFPRGTRSRPISGKTLRVYAHHVLPIVGWTSKNGLVAREGVHYTFLTTLAQVLNITANLKEAPGNVWGVLSADEKSYTGMIGFVGRSDVDMAMGSFFLLMSRSYGVAFALYTRGCTKFLVPTARKIENWKSVTSVFDEQTWWWFTTCGVIFTIAFVITRYLESKYVSPEEMKKKKTSERLIWPDIIAQALSTLMRRGEFVDENPFFRVLVNAWILVGFAFAGVFFRSVLTQKLTAPDYEPPVNSAPELVSRRIPLQFGELYTLLNVMYPQYKLSSVLDMRVTLGYLDCMDWISKGKRVAMLGGDELAFYHQRTTFWDTANAKPGFHLTDSCYMGTNVGWIVPKHSYYKRRVQDVFQKFNEAGLFRKWDRDFVETKRRTQGLSHQQRTKQNDDQNSALGMQHLDWVFWSGLYGLVASGFGFIFEIIAYWIQLRILKNRGTIQSW